MMQPPENNDDPKNSFSDKIYDLDKCIAFEYLTKTNLCPYSM